MSKIVQYSVVEAASLRDLTNVIQCAISDGYQPYGDLIFYPKLKYKFIQPMVKYGEDAELNSVSEGVVYGVRDRLPVAQPMGG